MRTPHSLLVLVATLTAACSRAPQVSADPGTADAESGSIVPEQESATHSGRPTAERASRAGATEEQRLLAFDGRALDARGAPLAGTTLTVQTWTERADLFTGDGREVATDADGRFHVELRAATTAPPPARFGLRLAAFPRGGGALLAAFVDVADPARAGARALGDVQLELDTPERALATFSDDALEAALRASIAKRPRIGNSTKDWVLQLAEAVRRGGPRWERVVRELDARQIEERTRAQRQQDEEDERVDPANEPSPPPAHDRHVLTTERRLHGRPHPIVLELLDPPVIEARFPTVPVVRCRVRSVEETERVKLTLGCQDENVGVVLDPSGRTADAPRHAARATQPRLCRHAPWFDTELEPGGVVDFVVDLPDRITLDEPGEHELAIVIDEDLRRGVDGPAPAFALRSAPFRVKLTADPIRLTRATYDGLRHELTSIPRDSCVKLVRAPWSPATTFAQDDLEPQDRIFRAGWKALPVLIDALDDPKVEARHQDWALGLLFDVTGLHQPAGDAYAASLIGRTCWEDAWPTTRRDVVFSDDRGNGYVVPDGTTLADLKSAWKALRVKLDVVIE